MTLSRPFAARAVLASIFGVLEGAVDPLCPSPLLILVVAQPSLITRLCVRLSTFHHISLCFLLRMTTVCSRVSDRCRRRSRYSHWLLRSSCSSESSRLLHPTLCLLQGLLFSSCYVPLLSRLARQDCPLGTGSGHARIDLLATFSSPHPHPITSTSAAPDPHSLIVFLRNVWLVFTSKAEHRSLVLGCAELPRLSSAPTHLRGSTSYTSARATGHAWSRGTAPAPTSLRGGIRVDDDERVE